MSWAIGIETFQPLPMVRTPTRTCRQGLYTLIRLFGMYGEGNFAKVSLEDFPYLRRFRWWVNNNGYASCKRTWKGKNRAFLMHKVVLTRMGLISDPFVKGSVGDHRNRDTLDNARLNLRVATRQQNSFNLTKRSLSEAFIGVHQDKGDRRDTYIAHISTGSDVKGRVGIGGYRTAEEAARVRDALARFYHGEFAVTNFDGTEAYDIETARRHKREKSGHASVYLGVTHLNRQREKPWVGRFYERGVREYLGVFSTEEAAARAVDAARVAHGLPRVNFSRLATALYNTLDTLNIEVSFPDQLAW